MGAAVGFISGLFGIGGGFLMTPLLIFLGIPPAVAVATQSAQIVASSTTSVLGALRRNALDRKLGAILVAGGFVGSALGVWFFAAARRAGQPRGTDGVGRFTLRNRQGKRPTPRRAPVRRARLARRLRSRSA